MESRKTVAVVGAGNVGEHVASLLSMKGIANVKMFDIPREVDGKVFEPVKGKALDIKQMTAGMGVDVYIEGFTVSPEGDGYENLKGSDIVVITAGFPRKPGMSREDLAERNISILSIIVEKLKQYAPDAIVIVVTNPVDIMTYVVLKLSNFPKERVVGMAGVLDSSRFKALIVDELKVSPKDVNAYVIGGHGNEMVPLISLSNVAGIPIKDLLPQEKIDEIINRTRFGGGEIVNLMGTSAYHAPAFSVVDMIEAMVFDTKRILPCSVYLEGDVGEYYGVQGFCVGVPVKLGRNGVEDIIKIPMIEEERRMWQDSINSVKKTVDMVEDILRERSSC